jgi:sulfur-oxidizing protein SoxX
MRQTARCAGGPGSYRPGAGPAARGPAYRRHGIRGLACIFFLSVAAAGMSAQAQAGGDPLRGLERLRQRHETGCILCHVVPGLPQGGALGPPLSDLASRYGAQALRQRIADARLFNPETVMPAYGTTEGLHNVAPAYRGQPVLSAQALDDIVSYLLVAPLPPGVLPAPPGSLWREGVRVVPSP